MIMPLSGMMCSVLLFVNLVTSVSTICAICSHEFSSILPYAIDYIYCLVFYAIEKHCGCVHGEILSSLTGGLTKRRLGFCNYISTM